MIQGRAAPLIEEATERSRVSMRTRWTRVKLSWRTMLQAAIAVALAWAVARVLWGHTAPFFAPVAAVIALGQSYFERGRRAAELVAAVTLGIAIADVLATEIGTGTVQLAVAAFVVIGLAIFFGSSQLFINQAATSAVLVFTITPPAKGITFARALDALTGGVVALVVAAVVFPTDPRRLLRDAARAVLEELAGTIEDVAAALAARDPEQAEDALMRAREIDDAIFRDAARESRETIRFVPARRGSRRTVESYADAADRVDLAVRNVRVLARGAIRALSLDENVPPDVAEALHRLAAAVRALEPALESGGDGFATVREQALAAAAVATHVLEGTHNLSVSVIVGQIRSTANDLLTGTGMSYEQASEAVRDAAAAEDDGH